MDEDQPIPAQHKPKPTEKQPDIFSSDGIIGRAIRTGALGLWLLGLYVVSGWLVVYSFSAHQLNNAITEFSEIGETPLSRWQITNIYLNWATLQEKIKTINSDITSQKSKINLLNNKEIEIQAVISKYESSSNAALQKMADLASQNNLKSDIAYEVFGRYEPATRASDQDKENFRALPGLQKMAGEFNEAEGLRSETYTGIYVIAEKINKIEDDISVLKKELSGIQIDLKQSLTIPGGKEDSPPTALPVRVGDFLNELVFLKPLQKRYFGIGFFKIPINPAPLIDMPTEMLTLVLILSMGALGSTIHLTQIYFSQASVPETQQRHLGFWYFLFRPFQGSITALAVYIFVKAGILVASTPEIGSNGTQISPYFVSFIGIISGLMAQSAIETIQRAGDKWFSASDKIGRERWAIGLDEKLGPPGSERQKTVKQIANLIGVNEDGIEEWASESGPVPYRYQSVLGAYFKTLVRDMFSDIQPRTEPAEPAPQ